MKVIDHEPQTWFLLEDAGALFLDGNYNHSAFGYDWMIQLSRDELDQYRQRGRAFIHELAQDVQNSAPILIASNSSYKTRRVPEEISSKAAKAIEAWKKASPVAESRT